MLCLVLAIPLLYFPGGDLLAMMAYEEPEVIDTKEEMINACIQYDQSSDLEKTTVQKQIRVEERAYMEAIYCELQADSAYQAQLLVLTLKLEEK